MPALRHFELTVKESESNILYSAANLPYDEFPLK